MFKFHPLSYLDFIVISVSFKICSFIHPCFICPFLSILFLCFFYISLFQWNILSLTHSLSLLFLLSLLKYFNFLNRISLFLIVILSFCLILYFFHSLGISFIHRIFLSFIVVFILSVITIKIYSPSSYLFPSDLIGFKLPYLFFKTFEIFFFPKYF